MFFNNKDNVAKFIGDCEEFAKTEDEKYALADLDNILTASCLTDENVESMSQRQIQNEKERHKVQCILRIYDQIIKGMGFQRYFPIKETKNKISYMPI